MNSKWMIFVYLAGIIACSKPQRKPVIEEVRLLGTAELDLPKKLSEWNLFKQPIAGLSPEEGLIPYDINTPLFTDYALKARFVKLPENIFAKYDSTEVMNFPVGTILVKNFYYQSDLTDQNSRRRIIETRLLVHKEIGWDALVYLWNEEQTEAELIITGKSVPVSWKDQNGVLQDVNYAVPNLVQCKSCHDKSGRITPIGPSARQLNKSYSYEDGVMNQLDKWHETGILTGLPTAANRPKLPVWNDSETGTLDQRARAWLEINCAHCHRPEGPAKNTGLYLTYAEKDEYRIGIQKPPVAAGRGSGGLKYAIVPGKPEQSIIALRISSTDPGVMMPELGRKMKHEEGVQLISDWIKQMK